MRTSIGAGHLISCLSLIVSFGEYSLWSSTGGGHTQTLLGTETVSPFLTNPMMMTYWLFIGLCSSGLAQTVREHLLAPIPWFSTREAACLLRMAGAVLLVPLVLLFLQLATAIKETGMDTVLSPFMARIGIPLGIMLNAVVVRYVAFNPVDVRTVGAFAEPVETPGIVVDVADARPQYPQPSPVRVKEMTK